MVSMFISLQICCLTPSSPSHCMKAYEWAQPSCYGQYAYEAFVDFFNVFDLSLTRSFVPTCFFVIVFWQLMFSRFPKLCTPTIVLPKLLAMFPFQLQNKSPKSLVIRPNRCFFFFHFFHIKILVKFNPPKN